MEEKGVKKVKIEKNMSSFSPDSRGPLPFVCTGRGDRGDSCPGDQSGAHPHTQADTLPWSAPPES